MKRELNIVSYLNIISVLQLNCKEIRTLRSVKNYHMEIVLVTRPAYAQTYIQMRTSFQGWQYAGSWWGGLTKEFLMDEGEYIKHIEILLSST